MSVINKLRKSLAGSGKGFFHAITLTLLGSFTYDVENAILRGVGTENLIFDEN